MAPTPANPEDGTAQPACPLCAAGAQQVLYRERALRVVHVADARWPGLCRVIWNAHVSEMTELPAPARTRLMAAVWATEAALRELLRPDKINLASLGNQVPHLHWHVIPRFENDPCFPDAIWAPARRDAPGARPPLDDAALAAAIRRRLTRRGHRKTGTTAHPLRLPDR